MNYNTRSIRLFIGAKNFERSSHFYRELGYEENRLSAKMSYFEISDSIGFYLQDYYVKKWVNNSMMFLEVDDLDSCYQETVKKELPVNYKNVKLGKIIDEDWGREFHLWDPSGVLWHFGEFV